MRGCFSQPKSPSSSSSYCSQNVVTCIYQTQLCNSLTPTDLTLTWSKTLFSHSLTISATDIFSITISLNSSFFRTRHRSKSIHNHKVKIHWNFTRAQFIQNSAEPESGFYLAISHSGKLQFFLGDLHRKKLDVKATNNNVVDPPLLLSRREHVFGSMSYMSRAVFMGWKHVIEIECGGGVLAVKVDGETRLVVNRLAWKFRGFEKIFIDGVQVEFYWDVLGWVVDTNSNNNENAHAHAQAHGVFVFQVGDGTVWPEMVGAQKKLINQKSLSCSSVLQWAEESSDCGRTSSSSSTNSSRTNATTFSLLLYAWTLN